MNIKEGTFQLLQSLSGLDTIKEEDTLQNDLMLDSLCMVMMLLAIEEEFQITLNESDMNPFDLKTVKNVIELIEKYQENNNEGH